ncbi:putative Trypsin-like serine protease [Microbacterium sp. TS-1]|uniref:S1-C subfamily serine protease n=2 Tax=Microbacterium TaxID=33882 RepID=A0ABU1HY31_9MICO|nr:MULTISPECIES: MarP family serine protease [Microbacterium]APF33146.1 serine protease [Microbacterium paludicola]MDR6166547.1 S1-C subfamily serine protease [Microbacterium paludicola]OAZ39482.1 colicin V production protein [Microbacterium arborescens]QCR40552.1 serine protease [Microbacterium sp. SGAir0570]GAD32799.1 putative Trypsin-like serine protease [Microbacterium sp. TS-1]
MLLVDVIVVILLVGFFAIGVTRGLVAIAGSLAGLVIGSLLAVWAVPLIAPGVADWEYRSLVLAVCAIAIIVLCTALGTAIGAALRRGVDRAKLRVLDRILGAGGATIAGGLVLLLGAGAVTASGMPLVATAVASSRVLSFIDGLTPDPVDTALAEVRGFVIDEGIPRIGELLRPEVEPTAPAVALDDPELQRAAASVARISGTAYACGVSMTGSGFVAADDLIVTNAHVVAGVDTPVVELPGRDAREGRVVYFDPVDDLAVIAVSDLGATPLPVVPPVAAGAAVAVQGYPLGGPFTSGAAFVLSVGSAPVPDIYDQSSTPREIYALDADVRPGNSGGPLLTDAGDVAGVVFARGADDERRGYAMTTTELLPVLAGVSADAPAVRAGSCTR